jgi:hypothetical protein
MKYIAVFVIAIKKICFPKDRSIEEIKFFQSIVANLFLHLMIVKFDNFYLRWNDCEMSVDSRILDFIFDNIKTNLNDSFEKKCR